MTTRICPPQVGQKVTTDSGCFMAMQMPIGSGAIESTVRRVVNLPLKGASIFWCRASAEAILLLRSYYKAGRWNLLKRMATSHLALLEA